MRVLLRSVGMVVIAAAATGCWSYLPPPAAPAHVVPTPSLEIGPPPAGASTVLFDADRPAQVSEVGARVETAVFGGQGSATAVGVVTHPICLTPCAAHLSRGSHQLVFQPAGSTAWGGDGVVQVGVNPVAYRYALGHRNPHLGARIGGWVMFAAGAGLAASGALYWALGEDSAVGGSSLSGIGKVQAFGGAGIAVAGLVLVMAFRPELQPGTGVQWDLPGDTAPGAAPPR